jgi:catechol 2,3-dioxygenase-like lactoylglutathione lyase family enzyme
VINGAHVIIFSQAPEADRAFFADVLGFPAVDAGNGWLIFTLPPAELAVHPAADTVTHELYLMCDDLDATINELTAKGVDFTGVVTEARWGRLTHIRLPGGSAVGLYQPT